MIFGLAPWSKETEFREKVVEEGWRYPERWGQSCLGLTVFEEQPSVEETCDLSCRVCPRQNIAPESLRRASEYNEQVLGWRVIQAQRMSLPWRHPGQSQTDEAGSRQEMDTL